MLLGAVFARLVWFIMNRDVIEGNVCIYIVEMWKLILTSFRFCGGAIIRHNDRSACS